MWKSKALGPVPEILTYSALSPIRWTADTISNGSFVWVVPTNTMSR